MNLGKRRGSFSLVVNHLRPLTGGGAALLVAPRTSAAAATAPPPLAALPVAFAVPLAFTAASLCAVWGRFELDVFACASDGKLYGANWKAAEAVSGLF